MRRTHVINGTSFHLLAGQKAVAIERGGRVMVVPAADLRMYVDFIRPRRKNPWLLLAGLMAALAQKLTAKFPGRSRKS